jgi:hypothetical protein
MESDIMPYIPYTVLPVFTAVGEAGVKGAIISSENALQEFGIAKRTVEDDVSGCAMYRQG